jgi:ABC-type sugar transport system substrate-binding protein
MKKSVSLIFVFVASMSLILTFSLVGCKPIATTGTQAETAMTTEATTTEVTTTEAVATETTGKVEITKHLKVAFIPPDMFNPWWTYGMQGILQVVAEEAEPKGIKIDIANLAPIKMFNVEEQVALLENAIQMKVDGIILCVIDQNSVIPGVKKAKEANIPTIAYSTDIPSPDILSWVGIDSVQCARDIMEYAIKGMGSKGDVLILSGIPGNLISQQRDDGFNDTLKKYPDINLLDNQPAYFNREKGMEAMENMMTRFAKIDAVVCSNDEIALGAYEAVLAAGRENEIKVYGMNGNKDTVASIMDGKITATVNEDPWKQGADSLRALLAYWDGKTVERNHIWPGKIIDKSNAEEPFKNFAIMENWYKP